MNRADTESFIVESAKAFFVKAKMSIEKTGNNLDLAEPIDSALRRIPIIPEISGQPQDSDIEQIQPGAIMFYKCVCMAETYSFIAGRLAAVDQSMPASGQRLSQYIDQALMMAKHWEERAKTFEIATVDPSAEIGGISIGRLSRRIPGELLTFRDRDYWEWTQ